MSDASRNDTSLYQLAIKFHQAGQLDKALEIYEKIIAANPFSAAAHYNMAIIFASRSAFRDAIASLQNTIQMHPENPSAHFGLGNCYTAIGDLPGAIRAYRRAVSLKPDFADAHFRLGSLLSETGEIADGFSHYMRRAVLTHGNAGPQTIDGNAPEHKVKHDREQQEYLNTMLGRRVGFHLGNGDRVAGFAVNPANTESRLLEQWRRSWPQFVIIDDFLMPAALERLRLYCAESTIWRRVYDAGYIGATPEDGLACPLIAQIAEETRAMFPEILAGHPFRYLGAFKYDSALSTGTNIHADNSAVNFNLYIAPDDANLDPETGGMDIWNVAVPDGVDMRVYNGNEAAARQFLQDSQAHITTIAHRSNRAILFRSDIFHRTSDCRFKEGYLNKRINVSFLFGNRGKSAG